MYTLKQLADISEMTHASSLYTIIDPNGVERGGIQNPTLEDVQDYEADGYRLEQRPSPARAIHLQGRITQFKLEPASPVRLSFEWNNRRWFTDEEGDGLYYVENASDGYDVMTAMSPREFSIHSYGLNDTRRVREYVRYALKRFAAAVKRAGLAPVF